jgi:hypothetical protein
MKLAIDAIRAGDAERPRGLLAHDPAVAAAPRAIVEAGRAGRPDALRALLDAGPDPVASRRGYRPLHALIQEKPPGERADLADHADRAEVGAERAAALELLLPRGADPEALGGWLARHETRAAGSPP